MGGQLAGGGDPRRGAAVVGDRVDASRKFVERRARLGDVDRASRLAGDVAEGGIHQSPLDDVFPHVPDLVADPVRVLERPGPESETVRRKGRQELLPEAMERFLLPGEPEAVPQNVRQVLHVRCVEYAGVVDVGLLQRHRARGHDAHPLEDRPLPVPEQGGGGSRGVPVALPAPGKRDVVEEGARLRVERNQAGRVRRGAADQEFGERERRRGGDHAEAIEARQDAGGQPGEIGGPRLDHRVVRRGDADPARLRRAVPEQLPLVFAEQRPQGCLPGKSGTGKEPSSRSPRTR